MRSPAADLGKSNGNVGFSSVKRQVTEPERRKITRATPELQLVGLPGACAEVNECHKPTSVRLNGESQHEPVPVRVCVEVLERVKRAVSESELRRSTWAAPNSRPSMRIVGEHRGLREDVVVEGNTVSQRDTPEANLGLFAGLPTARGEPEPVDGLRPENSVDAKLTEPRASILRSAFGRQVRDTGSR